MKKTFLTLALVTVCIAVCFAAIAGIAGKWEGKLKTETGEIYPLLYNFQIDGDKLTGTAKTPKGDMPIEDGKITGDSFKFTVSIEDIHIAHTGKFYGDSVGVDIEANGSKVHSTLKRCPLPLKGSLMRYSHSCLTINCYNKLTKSSQSKKINSSCYIYLNQNSHL
ncbi:glycoside hydrolase [Mucilaginibacter sp. P4]|uniref:glycoside hydrolase n=1 Tax=Mucilaginibacter sp. P4 TaxID=3383180 RepID=UPI0011F00D69|nr:glycoside hydrolase [Mucilaginibacter gossypii]QEM14789.1 glycoside hydrolase [Mucilaginibacter gossypii]